jgi:transcriptional regulator with XRE-family HTH domain
MAVTIKGSKTLFKMLHVSLQEKSMGRVTQRDIAHLTGIHETVISTWKKGKKVLNKVDDYALISEKIGLPIDYLYDVASEQVDPGKLPTVAQIRRNNLERSKNGAK